MDLQETNSFVSHAAMGSVELDLLGVPGYMVGLSVPASAMDLAEIELLLILGT